MRLILVTGPGGAGVTTFAAGTAVLAAEDGSRVLLLGTDRGALDDVLGPLAGWPAGLTVDAPSLEDVAGVGAPEVQAWLRTLFNWAGLDQALAQDLGLLPGAGALAALLAAVEPAAGDQVVVVDLGPTSQSLALLHLLCAEPTPVGEGERVGRLAARLAGPLVTRMVDLPRPDGIVREAGRRAVGRMRLLRGLLWDSSRTSLRLMLPADGRARRTETEAGTVTSLHGIGLDAIAGRAPSGSDGLPGAERLVMRWSEEPPLGCVSLGQAARVAYVGRDPTDVLAPPAKARIELNDDGAHLLLPLPPRPAEEFAVRRIGTRLEVRPGVWRRPIQLPLVLQPLHGRRAWHDGRMLYVAFER